MKPVVPKGSIMLLVWLLQNSRREVKRRYWFFLFRSKKALTIQSCFNQPPLEWHRQLQVVFLLEDLEEADGF